jgi:two-component system sensor histidine kinase ResE
MQTLVARTLDFIRSSESGGTVSAVVLADLIPRVVAGLPTADAERVHIDPPIGKGLAVMANAWGLERAIANLIDNALKYSPAGTMVDVSGSADGGRILLCVRDRGPGVPEDTLSLLKQPFYRVDAARNVDEGGVGLGLSIVDNLVRAYRGEVVFANHRDGGLLVTLVLPAAGEAQQERFIKPQ